MNGRYLIAALVTCAAVVSGVMACGQGPVGADACQTIEHARCKWIVQCYGDAANYGLPTRRSESTSPVDDCFRFYDDACQHGMVTNVPPTANEVNACVSAINGATDCTIVQNPETSDACAFLTFDAGLDADADY
jgi:hypothetical protein